MTISKQFLWLLTAWPLSYTTNYMLAYLLRFPRRKTFSAIFTTLCFLCAFVTVCLHTVWSGARVTNSAIQIAMLFTCAFLFSKEPARRKLLACGINIVVLSVPSVIVDRLILFLGADNSIGYIDPVARPLDLFVIRACYLIVAIALCYMVARIWDRLVRRATNHVLSYYVLFPLSQAAIILVSMLFIESHLTLLDAPSYYTVLSVAAGSCVLADIFLFRSMRQLTEKAAADERARWYASLAEQQHTYYEQHVADLEDAARIRHDIRNQLQTAYVLMQRDDKAAATELLDGLSERLARAKPFCQDRLVDSVLQVKAKLLDQAGIDYSFDCDVPAGLPIEGVTLCSLFANVLDNAYHAAAQVENDAEVVLRAGMREQTFWVSCRNSSPPKDTESPQRHGLGLTILQNIADEYHGAMETDLQEGTFSFSIILHLPEQA